MLTNIFLLIFLTGDYPKYLLLIIGIALTNPIAQLVAASTISTGYYNFYAVLILSILTEFCVDIFYFFIGRIFREKILEKKKILGVKRKSINNLRTKLGENFYKTLVFIKISGPLALPGLLALGISKVKIRKFLFSSILINIIKNIIVILIGFYLGFAINSLVNYLKIGQYFIIVIVIIAIIIYFLIKNKKN